MAQETAQYEWLVGGSDRRRIPRYSCSGEAHITCFPLAGTLVRGTVRDLGLGGCCIEGIETPSPFDLGAQTEILVKVNSWFFRAMGHVRAVRSRSGISVEFMRMSAGGYSMLADLIADLERPRMGVIPRKLALDPARRLVPGRSGLVLKGDIASVGTVVPPQPAGELSPGENGQDRVRHFQLLTASVDIFA